MSILGELKRAIIGPTTMEVCKITNPCPICDSTECIGEMHLDSDGGPELLNVKCPKCGPIKTLYPGRGRYRPEPRFEKNYWEAITGEFNKHRLRRKREV